MIEVHNFKINDEFIFSFVPLYAKATRKPEYERKEKSNNNIVVVET